MFTTAIAGGNNVDRITDFTVGTDKIALDHSIFTAVGSNGALSASMFTTGTPDADDRIIYNADTGATAAAMRPRSSSQRFPRI